MAGSSLAEGSGGSGRASRFLDGVVAFVVAIFQPIFHVLVSVISPSNQATRDQQNHQKASSTQQDQQQKDKDNANDSKLHNATAVAATTTSSPHDGDPTLDSHSRPDSDPNRMAPSLHNQPSTGHRPFQPMPLNQETNGQGPARGAAPRLDSTKVAVKQENLPTNGKRSGGHSNDRDLANANTNGQKFRVVGDEQAQENRQEQLTLPPPICEPEPAQDIDDGADEEPEDPAVAAERAIHHGFMNQALDMVRHILL